MADEGTNDKTAPSLVPLPFGIPVLDRLLGLEGASDPRKMRRQLKGKTSITLLGEDGTGKSVFALHLASAYQALTQYLMLASRAQKTETSSYPIVLYVSSDLPFAASQKTWRDFYLDHPWLRYIPSVVGAELEHRQKALPTGEQSCNPLDYLIELRHLTPHALHDDRGAMSIARYMSEIDNPSSEHPRAVVGFLDLCEQTSGDDWLLVSRIIAMAQERRTRDMPNLLILDSVAGFEALVGETNSFGEAMTRRARLAQLFRAAGNNWNIVLVSEEPDRARHHQEEYISDTVVHLYRRLEDRTVRRWFEIEKSRAHSFALGPHVFEVRDGKGSSTGSWENPDDPRAKISAEAAKVVLRNDGNRPLRPEFNAYVEVFPNLEYLSNEFARRQQPLQPHKSPGVEPFFIKNLDDMLDATDTAGSESPATIPRESGGLKHASVTAIVGDEGTRKAAVAEQFLLRAFDRLPSLVTQAYDLVKRYRQGKRRKGFVFFAAKNWKTFERDAMSPAKHGSTASTIDLIAQAPAGTYRLSVGGPEAPLMSRWDMPLYYVEGQKVDPALEAESILVTALAYLRSSAGLINPAVFICTHDASADDVSEWLFDEFEDAFRGVDPAFASGQTIRSHTYPTVKNKASDDDQKPPRAGDTSTVEIDVFKRHICRLIERFLVVRRLELQDASASKLWNIVQSCVERALHLQGHTMAAIHAATSPLPRAGAIRAVISDWRTIRDTYPSVTHDPLLLPTLLFRLRRSGVTTLLVDSENGQPDQSVGDPLSRALRNNVDRQIYTWKVPFFGEQRVALTVSPPGNERTSPVIRELRYERSKTRGRKRFGRVYVDRHFELYSELERGTPITVPLKVMLYAETPAFRTYADSENAVLSRLFEPSQSESGGVVELLSTDGYDSLHDYCHLSVRRRLPYSLVFMVDGFWGLGQNVALRSQIKYLYDKVGKVRTAAVDASDDDDHFGLFKPTALGFPPGENRRSYFRHKITSPFGVCYDYDTRLPDNITPSADRVPFSWDFGFLLCDRAAWERAKDVGLSVRALNRLPVDTPITVQAVWEGLRAYDSKGKEGGVVSWRAFLEASTQVARSEENRRAARVRPFDVAATSAEVFSCLILEIWLSEALNDIEVMRERASRLEPGDATFKDAANVWANYWSDKVAGVSLKTYATSESGERVRVGEVWLQTLLGFEYEQGYPLYEKVQRAVEECDRDPSTDRGAVRMLLSMPGLSFQLYKAWLLLLEALAFEEHVDDSPGFDLRRDRAASPDAVAVRHWYKTACDANKSLSSHTSADIAQMIPIALPGRFTTRGDWFLGAAAGSRSDLLVDQALDFFCSRRANRRRLQLGLGLPTRDIFEPDAHTRIRTALKTFSHGTVEHVTYDQIVGLGGRALETKGPIANGTGENDCGRRWLFRTGIMDYDRQSAAIRRWIHRLFSYTPTYRMRHWHEWEGGFKAYDEFADGDFSRLTKYRSFHDFIVSTGSFVSDLNNCTTYQPEREPVEIGPVPPWRRVLQGKT